MGNVPVLHGLGHLSLPALTLVEKANSGIGSVPIGPTEQLAERRQGPGGDHIGWGRGHGFNAADYDFWLLFQRHAAGGLAQEGRFPGVRLDQRDVEVRAQRRHDQPGKTSATAQIRQGFRPVRDQPLELGGIQDMATPYVLHRGPADQIDGLLPALQSTDQRFEPTPCFT
jgi:hypothetical protein